MLIEKNGLPLDDSQHQQLNQIEAWTRETCVRLSPLLEQRKQQDPLGVVRERLMGIGVDENTLDDVDLEVDAEIEEAVRFADESEPAREDVMMSSVLSPEADS